MLNVVATSAWLITKFPTNGETSSSGSSLQPVSKANDRNRAAKKLNLKFFISLSNLVNTILLNAE
jgi:hypothetical protein